MAESWREWLPVFDRWAPSYDEDTRDPWLAYEVAWEFVERSLRAGLDTIRGKRILDVGCGTGEFVRRLADLGAVGIGVEPSEGMRRVARSKVPSARFLDGHLAATSLPDDAVDAAIATYVVSHLAPAEQPGAIAELMRVVADRGPIVVVDVAAASLSDMPRVTDVLRAAGRESQVEWFERGSGLACPDWRVALEASGRTVAVEPLGPLLIGLAALPLP
ncbi:MAG TPA: methyltransferase domain-containing protein [Clostridia bacterium]|nr:methyltransferase domain-containing protein [Clostridia bacterium]